MLPRQSRKASSASRPRPEPDEPVRSTGFSLRATAEGDRTFLAPLHSIDRIPREPAVVRVIRAAVRSLPDAVHDADLSDPGEFHALFQLMLGIGVDPVVLAEHLEVGPATVARYAGGTSAPATIHARRGALIETVRVLEEGLRKRSLNCLAHLRPDGSEGESGGRLYRRA